MQLNLGQVRSIINKNRDFLKNTYHVKNIGIFGSVARADNTKFSDVDILVEFSKPTGFFKFIELEEYLSRVIGKKVDLVTKKALKPAIREEILREAAYV